MKFIKKYKQIFLLEIFKADTRCLLYFWLFINFWSIIANIYKAILGGKRIMTKINKKNLGLALGSGGIFGYAHLGVLRALEELDIRVDTLSGVSIGAIVAIFSAAGSTSLKMEEITKKYSAQVATLLASNFSIAGLTTPSHLLKELRKELPVTLFEALQKPVCIAATDIKTGKSIAYDSGEIWGPLSGSLSIPGIFPIVKYKDKFLVDGCLSSPILVKELRKRGAQKVIAVSLYDPSQHEEYKPSLNLPKFLDQSITLMLNNLSQIELDKADIVILPNLRNCKSSEVKDYIGRGYEATMNKKMEILSLVAV
jgi:NTE family protein